MTLQYGCQRSHRFLTEGKPSPHARRRDLSRPSARAFRPGCLFRLRASQALMFNPADPQRAKLIEVFTY
jgi:hypothetical protein